MRSSALSKINSTLLSKSFISAGPAAALLILFIYKLMDSDENVSHNTSYDSAANAAPIPRINDDDELMNNTTAQLYQVNEEEE